MRLWDIPEVKVCSQERRQLTFPLIVLSKPWYKQTQTSNDKADYRGKCRL